MHAKLSELREFQEAYLFSKMLFNVIDDHALLPAGQTSAAWFRLMCDALVDAR